MWQWEEIQEVLWLTHLTAVSSIGFRILPFHGRELGSIPSTATIFKDCKDSHAIEGLTVLYLRLEIETYKTIQDYPGRRVCRYCSPCTLQSLLGSCVGCPRFVRIV